MTKLFKKISVLVIIVAILIAVGVWWSLHSSNLKTVSIAPEVVLVIGEPYSQMLKDSTSGIIDQDVPNEIWYNQVNKSARLRFNDSQYGFITPIATKDLFTVGYVRGRVHELKLSPQLAPVNLDDAMKIILELQDQWRKGGWVLTRPGDSPAYEDTPAMREQSRNNQAPTTYWSAGNKYQIMVYLQRVHDTIFFQERYLITIAIAKPWTPKE